MTNCTPAVALLLLAVPRLLAQSWTDVDPWPSRLDTLVYDQVHARAVGFAIGTGATWSFDGAAWHRHTPAEVDGATVEVLGYDPAHGQVVVVVTPVGRGQPRTFVSQGAGFRLAYTGPAPRNGATTAFDPVGNRLLAFGGFEPVTGQPVDTTWSWNGTQWQQLTPAAAPPARWTTAMATDPVRQRIVLFGGDAGSGRLGDTWEWNGSTWQARTAPGPAPRQGALAFDPASNRVVLLGGHDGQGWRTDCWAFDGVSWTTRNNLPASAPVHGYTDGSALFVALETGPVNLYRWSGQAWAPVWSASGPPLRYYPAACTDPTGGVLMFGGDGTATTWRWNHGWQARASIGPWARSSAAMVPFQGNVILFGGLMPAPPTYGLFQDTWQWNGQAWTQLQPANSPPPRANHGLAPQAGGVLLFGGTGSSGLLGDTWRFDGTDWQQLLPAQSPSPRAGHAMATAVARNRVVLFGGQQQLQQQLADVWEWDGSTWAQVTPSQPVMPMVGSGRLVDDGSAAGMLLVHQDGCWRWDGVSWTFESDRVVLDAGYAAVAVDTASARVLLHDSAAATWLYGTTPAEAWVTMPACGSLPDLHLFGRAALGTTPAAHLEGAASTLAILAVGGQAATIAWGSGCYQAIATIGVTLAAVTDARGAVSLPMAVPAQPALRGVTLQLQAVVLDQGPVLGASFSNALQLRIGD